MIKTGIESDLVCQLYFYCYSRFITLVSSCALARLSTAMAKKTFSRVSGCSSVKDVLTVQHAALISDYNDSLMRDSQQYCNCIFHKQWAILVTLLRA